MQIHGIAKFQKPPNGVYQGRWCKHTVTFIVGNDLYTATTTHYNSDGPCIVTVENERATIT